MNNVYMVVRLFTFRNAMTVALDLDPVYTAESEARQDAAQWDKTGAELMTADLIQAIGAEHVHTGMSATDFLMSLGISKIGHHVKKKQVAEVFIDPDAKGLLDS